MIGPAIENFRSIVRQRSGLVLGADKAYLVTSRLEPIARRHGYGTVEALLIKLMACPPEALVRECVDAMATHESLFFRDGGPFEIFQGKILPALAAGRPADQPIRIWSAACSSGQEPYSLAMSLLEEPRLLGGRSVEIVATDMSEGILEKARLGVYSDFEIQRGLSPERRRRFFRERGQTFEIDAEVKRMVTFRRQNLLDSPSVLGRFDIIFCRNVLIYFDREGKAKVLSQLADVLSADGYLFLGSAENVFGVTTEFVPDPVLRGVFRPARAAEPFRMRPPSAAAASPF